MAMDYFELAQGSSMRMCLELEKRFPEFRRRQLELMMYLCVVAYDSEIYDGVCEDAWLRTTITLKDHVFSHDESRELIRLMESEIPQVTVLCQASWEWMRRELSSVTSSIEIRSNILPRGAYRERLQELVQKQSFWTRVQSSVLWRIPCFMGRRGFFPITVINQAREKDVPLMQKVNEWRRNGGRCDLATQLQSSAIPHRERRAGLRKIELRDVDSIKKLGGGASALVYKVSWRNGTYAMKSYYQSGFEAKNELYVASKVLHPHIVHGFGYCEKDGEHHLLMEVLEKTLTIHALEEGRVDGKPPFSQANTLEVLLQIASAMDYLHLHEMVHGDLKPDNILINSFEILGNERHFLAKVTDFGEARSIVPGRAFIPAGGGSTRYAAPELLMSRPSLGRTNSEIADPKKMDVYSFGGVAHEVLTGYPVYKERDKTEFTTEFRAGVTSGDLKPSGSEVWRNSGLKDRFSIELVDLVERCWKLDPQERPSFSEIRAELEKCKATLQNARVSIVPDTLLRA